MRSSYIVISSFGLLIPFVTFVYGESRPMPEYDCTRKEDGNYQHPYYCTKFVSCSGGVASERECATCNVDPERCPDGQTIYNVTLDTCTWATETECEVAGPDLPGSSALRLSSGSDHNENGEEILKIAPNEHSYPAPWYDCSVREPGNYVDPRACFSFITCDAHLQAIRRLCPVCPASLPDEVCLLGHQVYNATVDACLYANETRCETDDEESLASFCSEDLK